MIRYLMLVAALILCMEVSCKSTIAGKGQPVGSQRVIATPTPTPTPTPPPSSTYTCETTKTVCASGCDHTTGQAAINAIPQPTTDTYCIQWKNGTYDEALNLNKVGLSMTDPIVLTKFSGHSPILTNTGTGHGISVGNSSVASRYIIIDGLEIKESGNTGIKIQPEATGDITIMNCNIHDNRDIGIFNGGNPNVIIENNTIEGNGYENDTASCAVRTPPTNNLCHGIYVNNSDCLTSSTSITTTIRGNTFTNHLYGSGVQIQTPTSCATGSHLTGVVLENNIFDNNNVEILFSTRTSSVVRNNTFIRTTHGQINADNNASILSLLSNTYNNIVKNNIVYSTRTDVMPFRGVSGTIEDAFNYNQWRVPSSTAWRWNGTAQADFTSGGTKFTTVTSYEANGLCCQSEPLFVSGSDFHLTATSPARNTGLNAECATKDKDGNVRPQETTCDMGMDEFVP